MPETVNWGVMSTAGINDALFPGFARSPLATLVGVASRDQQRADDYAAVHGISKGFGSYEALLASDEIDAVYLSLPNHLHVEWTTKALEAGKHVLCEKPLTRHAEEATRLFDLADERGLHLTEAFMYRHHPQMAELRRLLGDGAVGELRLVRASFGFALFDEANIRLRVDADGGALMDVGCYCVSGARLVAGEPRRVYAEAYIGSSGTDWVLAATMRHDNDVLSHFDCGTALASRDELEVVGTEGTLYLDDPWHARNPVIEVRRGGAVEAIEVERADSYQLEIENLSEAILSGAPLLLGREDAVAQARALGALHDSAHDGEPRTLD